MLGTRKRDRYQGKQKRKRYSTGNVAARVDTDDDESYTNDQKTATCSTVASKQNPAAERATGKETSAAEAAMDGCQPTALSARLYTQEAHDPAQNFAVGGDEAAVEGTGEAFQNEAGRGGRMTAAGQIEGADLLKAVPRGLHDGGGGSGREARVAGHGVALQGVWHRGGSAGGGGGPIGDDAGPVALEGVVLGLQIGDGGLGNCDKVHGALQHGDGITLLGLRVTERPSEQRNLLGDPHATLLLDLAVEALGPRDGAAQWRGLRAGAFHVRDGRDGDGRDVCVNAISCALTCCASPPLRRARFSRAAPRLSRAAAAHARRENTSPCACFARF
ncbi:hypothetical protein FGB62_44g143 [Gracilaria domingensis]|nr:hypothetical protein FGB62_44g143 [Gracilaria domingensis]